MAVCHECGKDVGPDMLFCTWCQDYLGRRGAGKKAGVFGRWIAMMIDPGIALLAWLIPTLVFSAISNTLAAIFAILFPIAYFVWFLTLLAKGTTPGKMVMGLQVVDQRTGGIPGFGTMFVREVFGRLLSGLIFSLGYLWALFDKNAQTWHDKLAGTVVIKKSPSFAAVPVVTLAQSTQPGN